MKITSISAREILDSRGYPTIETTVELEDGSVGISSVPSGASTGKHEAVELRDNDPERFLGKGVLKAVENVNSLISKELHDKSVENQIGIDSRLTDLDGTEDKSRLGANAILSVSEACLKAASRAAKRPIYRHIFLEFGLAHGFTLPQPTFNIINGGKHGNGKLEFQEFHILPRTNQTFSEMMEMGDEVYLHLQKLLKDSNKYQGIGDEGGFTADLKSNKEALDWLEQAIEDAGFDKHEDLSVGLDVAASEFFHDGKYYLSDQPHPLSPQEMTDYLFKLNAQYNFAYLEDGLEQDDWQGWQKLTEKFSDLPTPIIGDDFLTTNPERVMQAIKGKNCNAVLVKPNQIGTITEVLDVVKMAKEADWSIILSHRSGETNDSFIADFAVGVGADIVKFGAPARGERVSKYNRLMEIEKEIS